MRKIKAVLVDDEINARENLRYLLGAFCKQVEVISEASNVDDAVQIIQKYQPQIVFLDIEMPQKNGFQLLEEFNEINFHVIFVTAYDTYAIKAFQVTAIDYLLKPIAVDLLQKAVEKVAINIQNKQLNTRVELLQQNKKQLTIIAIPYKTDYVIVNIIDIICIQADRMYSVIYTTNGKEFMVAKKLNYYENLLSDKDFFTRVHRSWMVNINHINSYSKKEKQLLTFTDKIISVGKTYKENFEKLMH
ncbi:LytR/AlgR family response regulator transcription factor [Tenacibaculum piscium]|uniref:LytR/AlgR family response regulator transcription factor n=1 Tax=Tenacibaculum piscium TaxID=1458515 RepID=UPI001F380B04|nr:response regulator transcription factor [Tenacibaculum piscium]